MQYRVTWCAKAIEQWEGWVEAETPEEAYGKALMGPWDGLEDANCFDTFPDKGDPKPYGFEVYNENGELAFDPWKEE